LAIYHLSVKSISRSSGRSAVAAAAYRSGERLLNERDGRAHDFKARSGVVSSFIAAPEDAPSWALDRQALWSTVELHETRSNASTAREWEAALPSELDAEQRDSLSREFAAAIVERFGVVVDCALHSPSKEGDDRNHHLHMLTTTREVTAEGLGKKTRELDAAKTRSAAVTEIRELWANLSNRALENAQVGERVDHRSHAAMRAEATEAAQEAERAERSLNPIGKRNRVQEAAERATEARQVVEALPDAPSTHKGPKLTAQERREAAQERREAAQKAEQAERDRIRARQHERFQAFVQKTKDAQEAEQQRQQAADALEQERRAEAEARERQEAERRAEMTRDFEKLAQVSLKAPLSTGRLSAEVLVEAYGVLEEIKEVGVRAFVRERLTRATEAAGRFVDRLLALGMMREDPYSELGDMGLADFYARQVSTAVRKSPETAMLSVAWAATAASLDHDLKPKLRERPAKELTMAEALEADLGPDRTLKLQQGLMLEAFKGRPGTTPEKLDKAQAYYEAEMAEGWDYADQLSLVQSHREMLVLQQKLEVQLKIEADIERSARQRPRDLDDGLEL
jgi:hypothetical protein